MGEQKSEPKVVQIGMAIERSTAHSIIPWKNYRHAPDWYADTKGETEQLGYDARRREIVFAVCLAEAYIVEWVLTDVTKRQMDDWQQFLSDLFSRRSPHELGLREKWEEIPRLAGEKLSISGQPDFGGPHGEEWKRLTNYRNGLIHALASLPHVAGEPSPLTTPTKSDLDALEPGWALGVAVERIRRLHEWSGTPLPDWMDP